MRNQKGNNNVRGDVVTWITKSLPNHAEKQVETLSKLGNVLNELPEEYGKEMRAALSAVANDNVREWADSISKDLAVQAGQLNKLAGMITRPSDAAHAIGMVDADDKVSVRKWAIVGDPSVVYCIKHCTPKNPTTRGHKYLVKKGENWEACGTLCQKCVAEMSGKNGHHVVRRFLRRKSSGNEDEKKPQRTQADSKSKALELLEQAGIIPRTESPKWEDVKEVAKTVPKPELKSMTVAELRSLAGSKGIAIPARARKADLIALIKA